VDEVINVWKVKVGMGGMPSTERASSLVWNLTSLVIVELLVDEYFLKDHEKAFWFNLPADDRIGHGHYLHCEVSFW